MEFRNYNEALASILASNDTSKLPNVLSELHDEKGIFVVDEGPLHDYKSEYPFSNSDSYFAGILRLICAFHNSYGGILIFGVHDKTRKGGHNKVFVDSEKINRKLRETLSRPVVISTHTYETASGAVQVLVVPTRKAMTPPVYITKIVAELLPRKVYIRKGAEVLDAKGSDLSFLYSERSTTFQEVAGSEASISSSLPASPSTIQEFVGRFRAIEKIVDWFGTSRDPRMFLWGQGGSGKSTIAYEAASLFADFGKLPRNKKGKNLDRVLFVSGKASFLNPQNGKIEVVRNRDFSDGLELFRSILTLSGWSSEEEIATYTRDQALEALDDLFDIETSLIVIDDIDTLTTSNVDSGMEELFLSLSRCASGTKVLYTLRNFPSFAPNAAVEVPGLQDGDFKQFTHLCCQKFSVATPDQKELDWIEVQSEGRPLAIETMIGMRRITSSYPEAFERWNQNSTEAREYLFSREYEMLSRDDRARHLLAALSIFDKPQSFEALKDVLQFSTEQLQDAIAETRDMFLRVSPNQSVKGDSYSIGPATRLFVAEVSKQLDRFKTIEARVQLFKSKANYSPAAHIPILNRCRKSINQGNPSDAVNLLTTPDFPPAFKEHPEVQALLGQAYANLSIPKVKEARSCFESAFTLGHTDYRMYLDWLNMERNNRTEVTNGIKICEKVLGSDDFDTKTRVEFFGKLARLQVLRSKDLAMTAPHEALSLRRQSLLSNLQAYSLNGTLEEGRNLTLRERTDDSLSISLRLALKENDFDSFFDTIEAVLGVGLILDEFSETVASRILEIKSRRPSNWRPIAARLNRLKSLVSKNQTAALGEKSQTKIKTSIDSMLAMAK